MSGKLIATIYFYVISVGAIVLMVIGVFNVVNFFVNSTQYDKYPLRYNMISNCDNPYGRGIDTYPAKPMLVPNEATLSAEEIKFNKELCLKNEVADRKQHQVDDMKNALTFPLVGIVLFLIHFPLARKQTKDV